MKSTILTAGIIATALTAFCGTGVTQRELTNAVNTAKVEMKAYTDAAVQSVTNIGTLATKQDITNAMDKVTSDFQAADATITAGYQAADAAVRSAFQTADSNITTAFRAADNTVRAEFAQADTRVANTAQDNLTNAVNHLVDFIEADLDASEPTFNADGTITIIHIDKSLGYPRRVKVKLMPHSRIVYSEWMGLRVVSSSYDPIPENTLFACIGNGSQFKNVTKGTINYEIATNQTFGGGSRYYHFYGNLSGGKVMDSSNSYLTDQNQVVVYNGTATMDHLVGSFTVEPYWLTEAEFNSLIASGDTQAEHNEWVERLSPFQIGIEYYFEQLDNLSASKKPKALKAGLPTFMNVPRQPMAPKYSWNEMYPPDEDHYWEPEEWFKEGDWNDPYNWLVFPMQVSIPYELNGQQFTKSKQVNDLAGLRKYFNVIVPPSPYVAPELKEKRDYCKEGQHIYVNCKCSKCPATRSHQYEPCGPSDGHCAQCTRHNTSVEKTKHGELKPTGDTGDRCTHICDDNIIDYHTGWHHLGYQSDDNYACSCLCGTYSPSKTLLQHDYPPESSIDHWEDCHDDRHHKGKVRCQRGYCRHEMEVLREHRVLPIYDEETGDPVNVAPWNDDYHVIRGDCEDCDARDVPDHLESHQMVGVHAGEKYTWSDGKEYTADHNFCYCRVCFDNSDNPIGGEALHDVHWQACGNIVNCIIWCARCDTLIAHNEHDFTTENKYDSDNYHLCYCELHEHKHKTNTTSEKCEGGYHWVEERDEWGQVIYSDWKECESWIDDGCEHDFHRDPHHGTKKIPCDSGRTADEPYDPDNPDPRPSPLPDPDNPERPDPNLRHIPQGRDKDPNPGPRPPRNPHPFRTINDPCPLHTKNIGLYWTVEWDDNYEVLIKTYWGGDMPAIYGYPIQWGTKHFEGNSKYQSMDFPVCQEASWLDWFGSKLPTSWAN